MTSGALLGLDVGSVRIGVSFAPAGLSIAQPLATIHYGDDDGSSACEQIRALVAQHGVAMVVSGWPRSLDGLTTAQTAFVEEFVAKLKAALDVPVELQDEALTSRQAEDELKSRGKPFSKEDVDALAATYILQDYLNERHAPLAVSADGDGNV